MNRPDTYVFKNSQACRGTGIASELPVSHDVIDISGRYPDEGYWARNLQAREQVIIARGIGSVAIRGEGDFLLDASSNDNRAVVIEPGEWFAWNGSMTISMVCQPPFDADNYEVKSEATITKGEE